VSCVLVLLRQGDTVELNLAVFTPVTRWASQELTPFLQLATIHIAVSHLWSPMPDESSLFILYLAPMKCPNTASPEYVSHLLGLPFCSTSAHIFPLSEFSITQRPSGLLFS